MSSIFSGTEVPAWLRDVAHPIDTNQTGTVFGELIGGLSNALASSKEKNAQGGNTSFWEELPQGFHTAAMNLRDPMWQLKVQEGQLNLASQKIQMDAQQNQITQRKQQMADVASDQETLAQWVQDYPTIESRADAPPPVLRSDFGNKAWEGIRAKDATGSLAKEQGAALARFKQGVAELYKTNPSEAARIGGMGPTPEGWAALQKTLPERVVPKTQSKDAQDIYARQSLVDFYGEESAQVQEFDKRIADKQELAKEKLEVEKARLKGNYPEPTVKTIGNHRYLFYMNYAPKKLDDLNPAQQEEIRMARVDYTQAVRDGDTNKIAEAKKKMEGVLGPILGTNPGTGVSVISISPAK